MKAETAIALVAEYPEHTEVIKAHIAAEASESDIRADLEHKTLVASADSATARADAADLKSLEQANDIEAKDDEIKTLKAEVKAFKEFSGQPKEPGAGPQSALASGEEKTDETGSPEGFVAQSVGDATVFVAEVGEA